MTAVFGVACALLIAISAGGPALASDRAAVALSTATVPGKRVALVIGNGAYQNAPQLPNPRNDASDIAELLHGLGFEVVDGFDLDKRAFEERIVEFSERTEGAEATLFYYAGHGMQVDGRNYLLPIDAALEKKASLPFQTVPVDTVLRFMTARNRVAIALLDACRDNPLSRRFALTRSSAAGLGLAMPITGGGIMIGFATAPGETAADGDGRNSPFAAALLRHLGTPGVEIGRAMRRVMGDVSTATNDRQRPWVHSDISVDFYMLPGTGEENHAALTPVQPPVESSETQAAAENQRQGSPQDTTAAGSLVRKTITVFANEKFDLCGFRGFSASLSPDSAGIGIASLDRSIPDRTFRGYENSLPVGETVRLWGNCSVTANYETRAGVTRLTFRC